MGEIVLVRHGETEWSAAGRHTSRTDLDLTNAGASAARQLRSALAGRRFVAVLCSPRRRALRTAELAGLAVTGVDGDLAEWDYGQFEGRTTVEIHATEPDWSLWTDGAPGGESPAQVGERADRVLGKVQPLLDGGDVALIGHGHCLRVVAARWIGFEPAAGARLRLDTATLSVLGFEHQGPVLRRWNAPVQS